MSIEYKFRDRSITLNGVLTKTTLTVKPVRINNETGEAVETDDKAVYWMFSTPEDALYAYINDVNKPPTFVSYGGHGTTLIQHLRVEFGQVMDEHDPDFDEDEDSED